MSDLPKRKEKTGIGIKDKLFFIMYILLSSFVWAADFPNPVPTFSEKKPQEQLLLLAFCTHF